MVPLGIPGSSPKLTKAQKQFNKLVARIAAQRLELAQWQAYVPVYQHRYVAEHEPLMTSLREARVAMVVMLDKAIDSKALSKLQRAKASDILLTHLRELPGLAEDAELVRLHDKYSDVRVEDIQRDEMEFARAMASETFGVDLDPNAEAMTPEALAQLIAERMQAAPAGQSPPPRKSRKTGAQAAAKEALRIQAEQGASQSMRDVYRKLARELHPDREPDPEMRARKTALMTEVNQAYEKGDLLALLELQLSIEQIDATALAGMTDERLLHYNRVLQEQSRRLQDELSETTMPFEMMMQGRSPSQLTPAKVDRGMDADLDQLQAALREMETDLKDYQDINRLKADLKSYRISSSQDDEDDMLEDIWFEMLRAHRR